MPADVLGRWLASKEARAGDKVYAYPLEPDDALWLFRHVRVEEAAPSPEAFDWAKVFDAVPGKGAQPGRVRGEEDYYRGRGTRGAR